MSTKSVSEETLEVLAEISKAQTAGILESTGFYSYDLAPMVSLVPVVTPWRDKVARVKSGNGNPFAVWRALMNANAAQPDPSMGFDYAANEVQFIEQDFQARYMPTGLAGFATQDAVDLASGYADPYGMATFQTLNQVLIGDDRKLMGAQSYALATAAAPVLVQSATGGSIGAVSLYIAAAARTGSGYYYGTGNSRATRSAVSTFGSGTTNSVQASVAAVKGAVAYDWFYSTDGTAFFYYTTTSVNTVAITKVIAANQALPALPDLATSWKGAANTVPTVSVAADNGSANANDYDGFLASCTGDYDPASGKYIQTGGAGTTNPAIWSSADGAALTLVGGSVAQIENSLFMPLWNQIKSSPTAIMMNAAQAQEIANLILGSSSATTFLNTDSQGRINVTAGGRVGEIVNAPAGGVTVPIEVHVSLPPGTIIARSDRVPFPQSGITNVMEYRNVRDTSQFDYGVSRVPNTLGGGPRREFEIRSLGAFVNYAPVAQAVLSNVG